MRRITGWFEPVGLPGDFFIELVELQANLRLPDGKIVISSFDNFFPGLVDFYVEGYEKEISKYLEFSQGASVLNKVDRADPARIMLLSVDQETFQRYKNTPGRYEADVEFRAHQYKMTASLPPHAGPRYWGDSGETRILSVVPHPDGWIITMRESKARRWIERKPQAGVFYVLKNRRTKEALLGRSYPTDIFGRFPVLERVVADHSPVYFTTTGVSNFEGSPINEEWLQQAELLRFEIHTIGHFSKSIHAEGFLMASR